MRRKALCTWHLERQHSSKSCLQQRLTLIISFQVFDAASKKIIRRLNGHSGPVRKLLFSPDKTRLVSVSDDKTFRVWDIAAESELASVVAHSDYVRTCALSHNGRILVTGSYDCTIKVWNLEDLTLIHTLNNNHPVEDVLISPNASVVISAGANILSFWDISIDGKLLHSMSPHQKTITSIAYTADCSHIITGGLDRHAKIVDLSSYRVIHSFKLASPVMCVACNSTDSAVAFGLANGHSVVKMRKLPSAVSPDVLPEIEFNFVASRQQFKFSRVERAFKAFRFRDALDSCLEEGNPRLTLSCCTELLAYDALAIALSGRDEHTLLPILKFISKTIQDPEFCHISMEVFASVIDIYGGNVGQSAKVDAQFRAISHKMKSEINVASMLSKMHGQLGMICSSSSRSVF